MRVPDKAEPCSAPMAVKVIPEEASTRGYRNRNRSVYIHLVFQSSQIGISLLIQNVRSIFGFT
jgi:hypothetical protein